ncbi:MAG: hypothetical protein U5K79_17090 [Cyclobacteriaceae bacterium]|nr:hypothetical protein [Cyclobacteriaceae bacterium]
MVGELTVVVGNKLIVNQVAGLEPVKVDYFVHVNGVFGNNSGGQRFLIGSLEFTVLVKFAQCECVAVKFEKELFVVGSGEDIAINFIKYIPALYSCSARQGCRGSRI